MKFTEILKRCLLEVGGRDEQDFRVEMKYELLLLFKFCISSVLPTLRRITHQQMKYLLWTSNSRFAETGPVSLILHALLLCAAIVTCLSVKLWWEVLKGIDCSKETDAFYYHYYDYLSFIAGGLRLGVKFKCWAGRCWRCCHCVMERNSKCFESSQLVYRYSVPFFVFCFFFAFWKNACTQSSSSSTFPATTYS